MAITARAIVDRFQQQLGVGWRDTPVDTFLAGNPDSDVTGIVTTYAPSLEVLHKAVAAGKNLVISLESPFWSRPAALLPGGTGPTGTQQGPPEFRTAAAPVGANAGGGGGRGAQAATIDPVQAVKRDYITANNLIVYRFVENWNARQPNPQLVGLLRALGWEASYTPPDGVPWATHDAAFVPIRPSTLREAAENIKRTLRMKSIRIIGDPATRVSRAAVSHGHALLVDLERYVAEPGVDLVLIGEAIWENEGMAYFLDLVAAGQQKGLILLGQEVSSEPGCGEMATWLKSFVSEVPVEWIPTGEPCWLPV